MSWLKLDDGFAEHPKLLSLTDREFRTWLRVLLYCCRYNTRGLVPRTAQAAIPTLSRSMLERFRDLGLLDVDDEGADRVHDFELYNGETVAIRVAKYLADHPNATANEVVKAVGGTRNLVLSEVARQRGTPLESEEVVVRGRFGTGTRGGTASEPLPGSEIGTHAREPVPSRPLRTTSSSTSTQDQAPAAALEDQLKALKWHAPQIDAGKNDPERAQAWVRAAEQRANGNPGGYAWRGFNSGDWPTEPTDQEKPKMHVAEACQRFIESVAWDDSFDQQAMTEEFRRIERRGRTEGHLDQASLAGLLEQWKATRQDRYGIPANLTP